jgi:hypothetical protein
MSALDKTQALVRCDLPVTALEKNERNPNKMKPREFDLLCDNLEQTGITDPILVRPLDYDTFAAVAEDDPTPAEIESSVSAHGLKFRIVGGHHRFDAAVYLGFEMVPVTVIMDEGFDDEAENFQLVRMNVIKGKMDPQAFFDLYSEMSGKYADDVLQDAFGFAEEAEFKKLIEQTSKHLPDKGMQQKFKEAAREIKTIDGLAKLLNEMFTKYGDTLPYGYMVVDYGGQDSIWVQVDKKTMDACRLVGTMCIEQQRTLDDVLGGVVKLIAKGELKDVVDKIIASTPEVEVPKGLGVTPTKDNIKTATEV